MSQTNTSTNNGQNQSQISGRGGWGQGGPSGSGRDDRRNGRGNNSIAKYLFEGKMKDGPISKLITIKSGYQPIQYKKIVDTPPVLCTDKNYQVINDVVWNRINLVEADFTLIYPDANRWSNTNHLKIRTVNQTDVRAADGARKSLDKGTIGI